MALFTDPGFSDGDRRAALYAGDVLVYSPCREALAFALFAEAMVREAFGSRDPERAQYEMPVDEYAALLGKLKPAFIHHPRCKELIRDLLLALGCDDATYSDVPRLRSSTSDGYLTTGIALAWHPHRDTWYSAPACQVNWWIPIWPVRADNTMCFYPRYFAEPVPNNSAGYNYYEHNAKHRGDHVAKMVKSDTRVMPGPTEPIDRSGELRVCPPVGGVLVFSGAHLHASVPNTSGRTRFSLDFRTVHIGDAIERRGAPTVDVHCTGSAIRDYRRTADWAEMPAEVVAAYDDGTGEAGELVYRAG